MKLNFRNRGGFFRVARDVFCRTALARAGIISQR